jgi:hypothetical protein
MPRRRQRDARRDHDPVADTDLDVIDEGEVDVAEEVVADVDVAPETRVERGEQHGSGTHRAENRLEECSASIAVARSRLVVVEDQVGPASWVLEGGLRFRVEQAPSNSLEYLVVPIGHALLPFLSASDAACGRSPSDIRYSETVGSGHRAVRGWVCES